MKRLFALLLALLLLSGLCGCDNSVDKETASLVNDATEQLKARWTERYSDDPNADGYLEIKNVRLISVKNTAGSNFVNVKYVVEYVLFTDSYGAHPYYTDAGIYDSVLVYEDGSMEVMMTNPFRTYRSQTYSADFSGVIDSIRDLNDAFNAVYHLR